MIEKALTSEVCEKHGLQPTVFYGRQKKLFEEGSAVFGPPRARQGKPGEAQEHCALALRINPGSVEASNTMGIILSLQGQIESAIAFYRESLRIDPNNGQARKMLGAALAEMVSTNRQSNPRREHQP